jgi:hypothetical protein
MNKLLGLMLLLAGLIVVTATSADFAYFNADRQVKIAIVPDDVELIDLKPIQPYAYITQNGMLVIDLSEYNGNWVDGYGMGVSPDSLYVFERVFGVSNHLWEDVPICMSIGYDGPEELTFFVGEYTGTSGDTIEVTINPGEVVEIGMAINSSGLVDGDDISGQLSFYAINGACEGEE